MKLRAVPADRPTDALAVAIAADRVGEPVDGVPDVPWGYLEAQGFTGEPGQCVPAPGSDGRVVLHVGVGPSGAVDAGRLRSAAAVATRAAGRQASLALAFGEFAADPEHATAIAEGAALGAYRYAGHRSTPPKDRALEEVLVVDPAGKAGKACKAAVAAGARRAEATNLVRDLVNEPGGALTAPVFAERAAAVAAANGVECKVHDEKAIRRLGLGGLLAVNRGSEVPPRFVELAWDPPRAGRATPTIALVGKGVTFDSGGLSMKTADGMLAMKSDMGGGGAVLGALSACRDLGVTVRVRGYIPLTDNMTGGDAQRVGDVITHYGGSTTEVLNTDAEGRLILADALALASSRTPAAVIDVATLTGACMVALGTRTAGLWANDDDLAERLAAAGAAAGERFWRMPLLDVEKKGLESKVADRKNVAGRYGGAIVASLFLRDFVADGVPWAHLDIAGPSFNEGGEEAEVPAGGTGFGVRTLLSLLAAWT